MREFLTELWQGQAKDSLQRLRTQAWNRFDALGLPTRKSEVFRYVPLHKYLANQYVAAKPAPAREKADILFVNGFYQPGEAKLPVVIAPLSQAMNTYGAFLNNQWSQHFKEERDPFAAVNGALHGEGVFIYVPPKVNASLEILNVIDCGDQPMWIQPRIHLFVGKGAEINLIRREKRLSGAGYGVNGSLTLTLDEGAHASYTHAILDQSPDLWHFESLRAEQKRDSVLKTFQATDGSASIRHDYHVTLSGENSEVFLNGILMLDEEREAHANLCVDHVAPNTRSNQLFKHVLKGKSRSSFEGKIYVHSEAQKTEAFQLNQNLLLSDEAYAYSKPNLEIFADDVKASHGATVGQLNEEQLFYLRTRGFSYEQAKKILIDGFCREVIDRIPNPTLQSEVAARLCSL